MNENKIQNRNAYLKPRKDNEFININYGRYMLIAFLIEKLSV